MHELKNLSRRRLMRLSAGAMLSAGIWPGARAAEGAPAPAMRFVVLNDLHYMDQKDRPFLEKSLGLARQTAASLYLVAGDLTEDASEREMGGIKALLTGLAPLRVVRGNHDFLAAGGAGPYEQTFPGSINYTFEHGGWQFVALDTCEGTKSDVIIQPHTLEYVRATVPKLDRRRPTILYTHFPLGPDVRYRPKNADALLEFFKPLNLRAVFGGHFHSFTERVSGDVTLVTNRCCAFRRNNHDGTKEKGFFVCDARAGKIAREFVQVN
jgi:predicted phosphodiesterase